MPSAPSSPSPHCGYLAQDAYSRPKGPAPRTLCFYNGKGWGKMPDYLFFYLCHVRYGLWNTSGGAGPLSSFPILPNTAETYLGSQYGFALAVRAPSLPSLPSQEPGMESGLQGTHSGPDSSSGACTGSLYSLGELAVAAGWRLIKMQT